MNEMGKITRAEGKRSVGAVLAIAILTAILAACASTPRGKGEVVMVATSVAPTEAGTLECEIALNPGSRTRFFGQAERNGSGGAVMAVERVRWFNNWRDGWTEADIAAAGTLLLSEGTDGKWRISPQGAIVLDRATKASIRYRDTFLSGDEATDLLNRRLGRVAVAVGFLAESLPRAADFKSFERAAGTALFPEIYGYPEGSQSSPATKENRRKGEGYAWDTAYSAARVPEALREVRDTGTLYRDWEESTELFYYLYLQANAQKENEI